MRSKKQKQAIGDSVMNCRSVTPAKAGVQGVLCHGKGTQILTSQKGIALLMVLWIVTILMVIVLSFSFATRTETHSTLSFKEGAEKKFIAEAGYERAIMEMFFRGFYKSKPETKEGTEIVRVDGTKYTGQLGNDSYEYSLLDESGKLNINLLTDISGIILNNLLVNRGVPKEQADTIVDSVLDWMDADELHRLHGAESDYYQSLPTPYKAKNNKFDSVEELLLVKGMTQEILYGTSKTAGIFDNLTVRTKVGGINLNTAPKDLLAALPGMSPEMANQIVSLRQSKEIKDVGEFKQAIGETFTKFASFVGVSESNIYTIEATGYKKGERQGTTVKGTIIVETGGKYTCSYYKSPAGVKNQEEPKR